MTKCFWTARCVCSSSFFLSLFFSSTPFSFLFFSFLLAIFNHIQTDLGERLSAAFNPHSKVPFSDVNLQSLRPSRPKWGPDSTTSEVSTIQLEFRDLSHAIGRPQYAESVKQVMS
jgi:hypothetical protein